jgi:ketopantoate reductase
MKVTVYGAGAIGGTTGAALARAGHDVLLVDSHAPHVGAIAELERLVYRQVIASPRNEPANLRAMF